MEREDPAGHGSVTITEVTVHGYEIREEASLHGFGASAKKALVVVLE